MSENTKKMCDNIKSTLSKEELRALEAEVLPLPVVVLSSTSTQEEVEQACEALKEGKNKVLGFDTETKPAFKKGVSHQVALLQLSSPRLVVLVRLIPAIDKKLIAPIHKLLKSKRIAKVGVAIADDARGLWSDYKLETNKMLDLRTLAKASGSEVLSLTKLYAVLYGKRISKGQRLSDWERSELTPAQIEYAALDAYAGLRIYEGFKHFLSRDMFQNFEVKKSKQREKK